MDDARIILCTCPDAESAERIADALIGERLAACVNRLPGVRSLFPWEGRVDSEEEELLVIKSRGALFAALRERIRHLHPYDVPEVLSLAVAEGDDDYLAWMAESLRDPEDRGS